jgi:phosphoribosyl 1,2-cyclic phosphodiesterase
VRYGGNTSCIEVRAGGEIIILDGGTGLRGLGRQLMTEFAGQSQHLTLLLSHTHWDHIQGLPFFQPIYNPRCQLRILGFEGARKGLVHVLTGQMESPYFPVPFGELPGNIEIEELKDLEFRVGPVRVQAAFANHPGICVGYRLFTEDGSIAFFPDNEPHCRHQGEVATEPAAGKGSLEYALAEEGKMVEFLRDTDVLVMDSQYDCDEYDSHVGWGHGCVDDCVAIALKAGVKQLYLFHHDPDHDDAKLEQMVTLARDIVTRQKGTLHVEIAREGAVVELAAIAKKSK